MSGRLVLHAPILTVMPRPELVQLSAFWSQWALVLCLVAAVVLVWWPFAEAVRRQRVGWAAAIILLAPVGGLAWFVAGPRHEAARVAS
jgi:hypothetical protein